MRLFRSYIKNLYIFSAVCFTVVLFCYIRTFFIVPGNLILLEGEEYVYDFKSPFTVSIAADKSGVIRLNNSDIKSGGRMVRLSDPIKLKTQRNGSVNLSMKLFGLIPLKILQVDVVPNKQVIACGNTIGVKLRISGLLVIGMSDVEMQDGRRVLPARDSGIRNGDIIVEANERKVEIIDEFIKAIDSCHGGLLKIRYKRGNVYNSTTVRPVIAADDNRYHIGLWVRDSTAGIGTLTFFDPESKMFGALGHGITDIDTGTLIPVGNGEILESNILTVKKGQQGSPGELKGVFIEDRNKLGIIRKNTSYGIYGLLNDNILQRIPQRLYPIALRTQVKEGPATILANIDGKKIDEYEIVIVKASKQNTDASKGMVIKVTDKRLLDATGGIVQGMSGSPIIQNGRIIGAVTHVLVNDPSRGYGVYIEWMIRNVNDNNLNSQEKAA